MIHRPFILCGYTSSGKSTVGKLLAEALSLPFYDTDEMLEQKTGMTPQELFARFGEAHFRALEAEIAKEIGALGPAVISTGGGMMTVPETAKLLSSLGTVIHIDRPFKDCYESLKKQPDRPLIKNNTEAELLSRYESRRKSYQAFASFTAKNNGAPKDAVAEILTFLSVS